jgi:hypothetical protein
MRRFAFWLCAGGGVMGLLLAACPPMPSARAAAPAKARSPRDALEATIKRPAVHATLAQAILDLSKLADVPIAVDWQGLLDAGVKPDAAVALPPADASLEKLLEQALVSVAARGRPLAVKAIDGGVIVTTQERALGGARFTMAEAPPAGAGATSRPAEVAQAAKPPQTGRAAKSAGRLQLKNAPLSEAIEAIRKASGLSIVANYKALQVSGITPETPITVDVADVSAAKALDLIMEQASGDKDKYASAYWILEDGVVTLTTGAALDAVTQTRVFDVADMLLSQPTFDGPKMNLALSGTETGTDTGLLRTETSGTSGKETRAAQTREEIEAKLAAVIQQAIPKDMWEPQGKGSISFIRDTMVVSQSKLGWLLLAKATR